MNDDGIDLNADLAEGCPWDEALLDRVSSASLSCGAHAGDADSIRRTLDASIARGVVVGAHPGYADRDHFGRRDRHDPPAALIAALDDQIGVLLDLARRAGASVRFVKPHGALYNQAQRDSGIAVAVLAVVGRLGLPIIGQPGSVVEAAAATAGVAFVGEGFLDRRYRPDGRLTPRSEPDAILDDPAEVDAQARRLAADPSIRTLCIHGDDARSVALADRTLATLRSAGYAVRPFATPDR